MGFKPTTAFRNDQTQNIWPIYQPSLWHCFCWKLVYRAQHPPCAQLPVAVFT